MLELEFKPQRMKDFLGYGGKLENIMFVVKEIQDDGYIMLKEVHMLNGMVIIGAQLIGRMKERHYKDFCRKMVKIYMPKTIILKRE